MRNTFKYAAFRAAVSIVAAIVMFSSCSFAPKGYKKYENKDAEISLVYPENWDIRSYEGSVVNFFSPREDAEDNFYENVGIVTIPLIGYDLNDDGLSDEISLDEYISFSKAEIGLYIDDYTELEIKDITVGDIAAKRLVYTGREKLSEGDEVSEEMDADEKAETEPVTYKWIQVIAIHDEVAYIITYTSLTDSPDVYIEMFDKMIDNCKIG
ncbi:MAG: DUF1795 domain-containing protein [Ruminococcaceae bacterium]|nr:DUF1795 domain-containing protein [Oscillospiraceae bacterium]